MGRVVGVLAILMSLTVPAPADGWGFDGHKYIMAAVIPRLPAAIRPFFVANRTTIVEHAIDPDLWRTAGWEQEPPRHFLDMDAYDTYPFAALPHLEADAVAKHGRAFVDKNGTLPWRTEEIYGKLVEAFKQTSPYARENIKFFSSVLAHYVADAHVPFHAAVNYDGQVTRQWGIHSRFESELFQRYRGSVVVRPGPRVAVPNIREMIFGSLTESFGFVAAVLEADEVAAAGRDTYDNGYYALFFARTRQVLEARLADSIRDVDSVITAAWIEAGRPALPVQARRTPAKVRRH